LGKGPVCNDWISGRIVYTKLDKSQLDPDTDRTHLRKLKNQRYRK